MPTIRKQTTGEEPRNEARINIEYLTHNILVRLYDMHEYRFLQSDATATIFLLLIFVRLLFEGGIHFLEKPVDISDGWIRYVQAI